MRRWFYSAAVVAVTGLAVLMLPVRSEAQRGGRGGRGGGGGGRAAAVRGGRADGFRGEGVRGDRDFDRGRGWGWGVGVGWGGPGWGWGGWGYGPGYVYDGAPAYYAPDNSYIYDEAPAEGYVVGDQQGAQPYYSAEDTGSNDTQAQDNNVAHVSVRLPAADATLWFNGARMLAQGQNRSFTTPPLEPGQDYHYQVRVRFMQNGKPVTKTRTVDVRAGQTARLDFTHAASGRTGEASHREDNVIREGSRPNLDGNRKPADTNPNRGPNDIRRPRDSERNPATPPNDVNRPGANRPADANRPAGANPRSDTNGQSQPNRNPAGDRNNNNPRPND